MKLLPLKTLMFGGMLLAVGCGTPSNENKEENSASNESSTMTHDLYIGTYTSGSSEGIYHVSFNENTGIAGQVSLVAATPNPSFIALSGSGHVYAVNEDLSMEGVSDAGVSAWEIQEDHKLIETGNVSAEGAYACYIAINSSADYALVANYGGGSVLSVPITAPGALGGTSQLIQHEGSGPNAARQEGPHAHSIVLSPDERYALAADLGTDKIMIYRVDSEGMLLPNNPASVSTVPGAGPRHIAFHPNGQQVYVVNELNSTVIAYDYAAEKGTLLEKQTITTLPENYSGESYCADIHVHPSGQFLYASNRGHDSIVVYAIGFDGSLSFVQHFSTDVNWPRNFMISPNGMFILVANERSDDIVIGEIDTSTGMIKDTGRRIDVPSPVCIVSQPG